MMRDRAGTTRSRRVPAFVAVALGAALAGSGFAAGAHAADSYAYDAAKGKSLFTSTCAACHQATGAGIPGAFPALKGNAAVNDADPAQHLHAIVFGAHDLIIGGKKYASPMPPFGAQLDDREIADIANYERSSWGNTGKQVSADDVAAVRKKGEGAAR